MDELNSALAAGRWLEEDRLRWERLAEAAHAAIPDVLATLRDIRALLADIRRLAGAEEG